MLDSAGDHVAVERPASVLDAVHDEHLGAAQAETELLVRVAVQRHHGAGLELDQVDHRPLAEERPTGHPGGELEGLHVGQLEELWTGHSAIIAAVMGKRQEYRVAGQAEPLSHYTDAVRAGDLLFVSGCVPVDGSGELVGGDDVVEQARQVFRNIGAILAAAGASLRDVVKVTVFLVDIDDRARINPVRQEVFGDARPASTLIEVSRLAVPGARLEIEAVAQLP